MIHDARFNHFFLVRATNSIWRPRVYFRAIHSGHLRRAFPEGRLTREQMDNFRQEVHGNGLFHPHPKTDAGIPAVPDRLWRGWAQSVLPNVRNSQNT